MSDYMVGDRVRLRPEAEEVQEGELEVGTEGVVVHVAVDVAYPIIVQIDDYEYGEDDELTWILPGLVGHLFEPQELDVVPTEPTGSPLGVAETDL